MSDVTEYKCPSCNASMVFDSKSQHMKWSVLRDGNDGRRVSAHAEIRRYTDDRKTISNDNWYSMSTGQWQNNELNRHARLQLPVLWK